MTPFRNPVAIAAAALAVVAGGVAIAQMKPAHVLTVRLADGSVEQIRYSGDVPPQVSLRHAGVPITFVPADDLFGAGPPFDVLDGVFADMDRQAAAMLEQANAIQAQAIQAGPHGLMQTGFGALPAGVRSYSVVTTIEGGKTCTRTTELTGGGAGHAPKLLTSNSGDCTSTEAPTAPTVTHDPVAQPRAAGVVQASYRDGDAIKAAPHPVSLDD